MYRPLEVYIAARYLRAKRKNHFISFISVISMVGIALGVWTLITVMSVMNGYERDVKDRMLSMVSHATIDGIGYSSSHWNDLMQQVKQHPEVVGVAPYFSAQAMISKGDDSVGVLLSGIDPSHEPQVSDIGDKLLSGTLNSLSPDRPEVILGKDLAERLQVTTGEKVTLVVPGTGKHYTGMPRFKVVKVVGIFQIGLYEFDSRVIFMHLASASRLFRTEGQISGLRLRLDDALKAPMVSRALVNGLPDFYLVSDWTSRYSNLFRAIAMQKRMMFFILLLIIAVAAFNIVSTLVMVVTDKKADIAILRTLGASPKNILSVFVIQGLFIGVVGILIGVLSGLATAVHVEGILTTVERWLSTDLLPADIYNITQLSAVIHWDDVVLIAISAIFLILIATLYPAWRAARIQPVEALRYD